MSQQSPNLEKRLKTWYLYSGYLKILGYQIFWVTVSYGRLRLTKQTCKKNPKCKQ